MILLKIVFVVPTTESTLDVTTVAPPMSIFPPIGEPETTSQSIETTAVMDGKVKKAISRRDQLKLKAVNISDLVTQAECFFEREPEIVKTISFFSLLFFF